MTSACIAALLTSADLRLSVAVISLCGAGALAMVVMARLQQPRNPGRAVRPIAVWIPSDEPALERAPNGSVDASGEKVAEPA